MNDINDPISADQVVRVIRRRWFAVAQLVVAGIAVAVLLAVAAGERHEATATVLIESASGDASSAVPGRLSADAAARLVRTRSVAQRVAGELDDGRSAGELLAAVSTSRDASGAFVNITAQDDSPAGAADLANAFAREFIAARTETVTARMRDAIGAAEHELADLPAGRQRSQLADAIAELRAAAAPGRIDAEVIDPAVADAAQAEGLPLREAAVGAGLGLLLGLVLVFSLEALDPRVRALGEMRRLVGAPQLAAISRRRHRRRRGSAAPVLVTPPEPFEQLRSALLVLNGDRKLRRIIVTSARDREEGKTVVAANLAVSLARLGLRVCAVDADLRRPALAAEFGRDDEPGGLAAALRGTALSDATQRFELPVERGSNGNRPHPTALSIVAGGSSETNAADLLAGPRMQQLLEQLDSEHDVVILDCAPLLAVGDALPLLHGASGTILVARHSHTQRRAVVRAASMVAEAHGTLLGVVTTGVPEAELAAEGSGPWPAAAGSRHEL